MTKKIPLNMGMGNANRWVKCRAWDFFWFGAKPVWLFRKRKSKQNKALKKYYEPIH